MAEETSPRPAAMAAGALGGDGPHAVSADSFDVVLVRTSTGLRAYQGRCPHQGALLGEGEIDGDVLVCRNHGWRFTVETGERQGGPERLVACRVVEEAGEILVDTSSLVEAGPRLSARRGVEDLPGPRGLPLIGNALKIRRSHLHEIVDGWVAKYGPIYTFRIGPRPTVVVADPPLCVQILKARPETYRRISKIHSVILEMGMEGPFSAEGSAWRMQRRLAMEAFSNRNMPAFYPTMRTVAERLLRRLEIAADRGEVLDITTLLKRFTVDVTTLLTFGYDVNTIDQPGDDIIQRHLEMVMPAIGRRIFALFPYWRLVRLPFDRRLDRALVELRVWSDALAAQARARLKAEASLEPSSFLEAILLASDEGERPLPDHVVFGNLMNMLSAGEDTTAYSVAWAVHELCESAASVESLREELDLVLDSAPLPTDIATARRLRFAAAVANETMRLRPVAPMTPLETLVDTVVDDVFLPAGTEVLLSARTPVHDPARFREPETYLPERWLEGTKVNPHDAGAALPFGSGPRVCPGRSLALLEMQVVLALLYKNFDVTRIGRASDVSEVYAFTMLPKGLRISMRHRSEREERPGVVA